MVVVALLAGCAADPVELAVDVRTDLPPGDTFVSVHTELVGHGARDFGAFRGVRFIDGVRVVFDPTSWFLVRASNTSPYLTIRLEAETKEKLLEMKNILADELEKHPGITDTLNRDAVSTKTGRLGWV